MNSKIHHTKCYCGAIIDHSQLTDIFINNKDVVCSLCQTVINQYVLNQRDNINYGGLDGKMYSKSNKNTDGNR